MKIKSIVPPVRKLSILQNKQEQTTTYLERNDHKTFRFQMEKETLNALCAPKPIKSDQSLSIAHFQKLTQQRSPNL